jgi:hypothetical protein
MRATRFFGPFRIFFILLMGLIGANASAKPVLLTSQVPIEPLRQKLKDSGGDPAQILRPKKLADLGRFETGKRYKFVVLASGQLAVAPLPADAQHNEYVHPILADGAAVQTAGGLRVERDGEKLKAVVVDQDSKAYCPTLESLGAARSALVALGVPATQIRLDDHSPGCTAKTE